MSRPEEGIASGTVLLGKYRVEEKIGRGGMGLVYRAHHLALDELVAIKILRADVQLDDESVQRFQREAQAAVRLKSEHVARITDVGTFEDGSPYMVMEFLAGADLGSIVEDHGPMPVANAVDLVLQACDALAEAHSLNIVHRDVKPSNLFVTTRPDGAPMVKILDFGISKSAHGTDLSLTQTASVLGTPAYMSPEQMRSARRVDGRTDIWSLGTVLYELVEGRRPFMAETFSEMCVMAAADPYEPMVLAPQLEPVIARCLAKTPEERYPTMADLAQDLAPYANDPQRAQFYVARIHRVLGRALDASRPHAMPMASSTPTPVPGLVNPFQSIMRDAGSSTPSMELGRQPSSPVTLSTIVDPKPQRSRMKLVVGGALLVSAVAIAVVLVSGAGKKRAPSVDDHAETANKPSEIVTIPTTGGPDVGSGSGSSGSAVGHGSHGSGSATGDDAATVAGSNAKAGSGSGKSVRKQQHQIVKRGNGGNTARGSGDPKKGSGDGKKGSAAAAGSSTPPPKKCNPFESARPCPKETP